MRIDLRNEHRQRLFAVHVDLEDPPTVVRPPQGGESVVHLDWDRAIDDEHHLRHCPACGCPDLFARKRLPQLTGFVLILLATFVSVVLVGLGEWTLALFVLLLVMAVDVTIFLFAPKVLVCYRCHSEYANLPINPRHPAWQNTIDEKYPRPDSPAAADGTGTARPSTKPDDRADDQADEPPTKPAHDTDDKTDDDTDTPRQQETASR